MQKIASKIAKGVNNVFLLPNESTPKSALRISRRVDITSVTLCNKILDRLAPSLNGYKQCDIIDLNPGRGVWSSKIHQYLRPRSHILLEPQEQQYMQWLRPLLDAPDSVYKHVPWNPFSPETYRTLNEAGYLPHQVRDLPGMLSKESCNPTLLCLGNISVNEPRPSGSRMSKGYHSLQFRTLLQSMLQRELFHKYGAVRMLLWMTDKDKSGVLPRALHSRTSKSILADMAADPIQEVAGIFSISSPSAVCSDRSNPAHKSLAMAKKTKFLKDQILDLDRLIINKAHKTIESPSKSSSHHDSINAMPDEQRLSDLWSQVPKRDAANVERAVDEQRAHNLGVPLLQWNRRTYEPLEVDASQFHPKVGLALLDLHPREGERPWMKHRYNISDVELIIKVLFERSRLGLSEALDNLAPGASEALIPQLRTLKHLADPRKTLVRSLPKETIDELLDAWFQWSLRLTGKDLFRYHSSDTYLDPDTPRG
ncbi:MAG: hypothetical protein M1814_002559 [Vezdaea aestivalis]|nr:MAG: hypothetical protein M1814_002559 [Vezdaea aestivalis]